MNGASAAVVAKLAFAEIKRWAEAHPGTPMGEWRGNLVKVDVGKNAWQVGQDDADPCRLWIPAFGLEYAWPSGGWLSDGPSIPWAACKILDCERTTFLKSGFLHDFCYRAGAIYARVPGGKWVRIAVTKRQADILLRVGVNAEGATNGQELAIYAGVRTPFGRKAWNDWRAKDV